MNLRLFTKVLFIVAAMLVGPQVWAAGTHYYISSTQGDDENEGTSPERPWKSLDKIWLMRPLQPGDRVLLKRGDNWDGNIVANARGTPENRVVVSSYGDGPEPIIYGDRHSLAWTEVAGHAGVFRARIGRRAIFTLELKGKKVTRYEKGSKGKVKDATLKDLPLGEYWTSYYEPHVYYRPKETKLPSYYDLRVIRQQVIAGEGDYLTIENLHVVGGVVGVDADGTTGFVARGLTIEDTQGTGIYFKKENTDGLAEDNLVQRAGNTALYTRYSTRITMRRNRVYGVDGVAGDRCLVGLEKSLHTTVEDNLLVDARCGIDYHYDRGSIVRNNVVAQTEVCFIPHGTDMQVHGNTCWLEGRPESFPRKGVNVRNDNVEGYLGTASFHDNTIYNCTIFCLRSITPGASLSNNVIFGASDNSYYAAVHLSAGVVSDHNTYVIDESVAKWRWGGDGTEGKEYRDFAEFQSVSGQELNSTVEPSRGACWRMPLDDFLASYNIDTNKNGIADFCEPN